MRGIGSSAYKALLPPVTCTAPARRQPILGVTPRPLLLRASSSPAASGWHLLWTQRATEGLLRSPSSLLEPLGRRYPPGFMTVPTGQSYDCQRRILCLFGSSVSASYAGLQSRWLNHVFACATHRFLLDGVSGLRLPDTAVYPRFSPLRTSRETGGYAGTSAPEG